MKEFISRFGVYIASLSAVAFAFSNPGPESIAGAIVAVLGYLALDVWWYQVGRVSPHDVELFTKFKTLFPSSYGFIVLIRDHDFGGDFQHGLLESLHEFYHDWDNEEHHFHDRQLNKALNEFRKEMIKLSREIGARTAPSRVNAEWQTARVGEGFNGGEDECHTRENAKVLNELATHCYELHQKLMKTGREVLRCQKVL
jgi:hypothetical protein